MQYFCYFQIYLVMSLVFADKRNQNMISDTEIDCSSIEFSATTRKLDVENKVTGNDLGKSGRKIKETSKHRRHKKNRRQKTSSGLTIPKIGFVSADSTTEQQPYVDNFETTVRDVYSMEQQPNRTEPFVDATEYMEEFTDASPVINATTIDTVTWSYQGNKSSEESDESKSTLIDYPFSVSIQKKGAHYATGALLSKFWVITAAGDFYNVRESLKLFRVRLGSVDCKNGGTVIPIKKIEIHPYYVNGMPNFDIALLRMAMYVEYNTFIRPIVISSINGKVLSAKFMTTYWPRILVKGLILPQHARERVKFNSMRVSTQRLIPDEECADIMKNINITLNESSLCLKPVITHHTICTPDVGAPVIAEDGLWGITSGWISPLCPMSTAPTIFTRLSLISVRSWLHSHIQTLR